MSQAPARVAVVPGDGIGPEVVEAAIGVLEATGVPLSFERHEAGDGCLQRRGCALPDETLQAALSADAVLLGAVGDTAADVVLPLRRELGTFVNVRPSRSYPGVECLYPDLNLVIVRENTECLYRGIESRLTQDVATATRLITREASARVTRFGFEYARANGFSKVTAVHKANVLRESDGLFLEAARAVAKNFPEVEFEDGLVDAVAMHLVLHPQRYQVLVTPNLFGDILSDLAAGLVGGLGLSPSANLGASNALFEPVHGTAPDIAGEGIANPTAAILCGALLLKHLGHNKTGEAIETAVQRALQAGQTTPDLGGRLSTDEAARAVIQHLEAS